LKIDVESFLVAGVAGDEHTRARSENDIQLSGSVSVARRANGKPVIKMRDTETTRLKLRKTHTPSAGCRVKAIAVMELHHNYDLKS
jgi:hypothetical protein